MTQLGSDRGDPHPLLHLSYIFWASGRPGFSEHPGERRLSGLQAPAREEVLPCDSWTSELGLWLPLAVQERRPDGGDVNHRPPGRGVRTSHLQLASPQPATLDAGDPFLAVSAHLGHCRISSSIPGLCSPDANSLPSVGTTGNICRRCKTSPVENHGPK